MITNNFDLPAEVPQAAAPALDVNPLMAEVQADRSAQQLAAQKQPAGATQRFDQALDDSSKHKFSPELAHIRNSMEAQNADMRKSLSTDEALKLCTLEKGVLTSDVAAIDKVVKSFANNPNQANNLMAVFSKDMAAMGLKDCNWSAGQSAAGKLNLTEGFSTLTFATDQAPEAVNLYSNIWPRNEAILDKMDDLIVRKVLNFAPLSTPGETKRAVAEEKLDELETAKHTQTMANGQIVRDYPDKSVVTFVSPYSMVLSSPDGAAQATQWDPKTFVTTVESTGPKPEENYNGWLWPDRSTKVEYADGTGYTTKIGAGPDDGDSVHHWGPKPADNYDGKRWAAARLL